MNTKRQASKKHPMFDTLTTIAQRWLDIATLKSRNSGSLDFHEVGVSDLAAALKAAYLAGYAASIRAAQDSAADALPTEVHTIRGKDWLHGGPVEPGDGQGARTVITLPIPEVECLHWVGCERDTAEHLIPAAIAQRRLDIAKVSNG